MHRRICRPGLRTRPARGGFLWIAAPLLVPGALRAQQGPGIATTIDTVVIVTADPFPPDAARSSGVLRLLNGIHVATRPWVIRKELLFAAGDTANPLLLAESERNLRSLQLFGHVAVDTARLGDRFAVVVDARDSWSPAPKLAFSAATDGTTTGTVGISDANLLGTGHRASAAYRKEVDRHGIDVRFGASRFLGSPFLLDATYINYSDGRQATWRAGLPFRSSLARAALEFDGVAADRRVLQFRTEGTEPTDTTVYWRTAVIAHLKGTVAAIATPRTSLRIGVTTQVKHEEYAAIADTGLALPDSVSWSFGGFLEARAPRFVTLQYYRGFTEEDVSVGPAVSAEVLLAPAGIGGYGRFGIGPRLRLEGGVALPHGFVAGAAEGNLLFGADGADSGRVVVELTAATQWLPRQSTVLHVEGGVQHHPPPGDEFDLGFNTPPRSYVPHSFTGTRALWASLEQRWYVWDALFKFLGVGFAAFLDYGGAWYDDQPSRWGGAVGGGLRLGSGLASAARTARIDVGYLIGKYEVERRIVVTFGGGFEF